MARKQSIHRKNKQYEAAKKKLGKPFFESKGIAIYQADTLELSSKLPANVIDALITDPPYCSGAAGSAVMADPSKKYCQSGKTLGRPSFGGDFRDQRSFKYWCSLWISQAFNASKDSAYCLIFTDWRQLATTTDAESDPMCPCQWSGIRPILWFRNNTGRLSSRGTLCYRLRSFRAVLRDCCPENRSGPARGIAQVSEAVIFDNTSQYIQCENAIKYIIPDRF